MLSACTGGGSSEVSSDTAASIPTSESTPADSAVDTTEPTDDSTTAAPPPSSTVPPSSTTLGSEPPPVSALPTTCQWQGPTPSGATTFIVGAQLFEIGADGQVACLTDIDPGDTGPVRWSPDATRVLIGGATIAGDFGSRDTGYFPENLDVTWSAPTGKALVAPSVRDGGLVWRSSDNAGDRKDVSFLTDTVAAAYHPAGKAIAAIGVSETGSAGLYLATNRGEDRQQLTFLEDPATAITELAWDADGSSLSFIHDHSGFHHVHRLIVNGLVLTDISQEDGVGDMLVASTVSQGDIAWRQTLGAQVTVRASFANGLAESYPPSVPGVGAEPVGWLGRELIVLERPAADPTEPGTLWAWSGGASVRQLIAGVERAAVRIPRGAYVELPTEIIQQAVG
jgi:hypothetical protein